MQICWHANPANRPVSRSNDWYTFLIISDLKNFYTIGDLLSAVTVLATGTSHASGMQLLLNYILVIDGGMPV